MLNKILLIRNVSPEKYGGGETYQLILAEELKSHNFTPILVSSSEKLLAEAKNRGFETRKAPFLSRQNWSGVYNLLLPLYFLKLRKLKKFYKNLFEKEKPTVVNIQSRDDWLAATPVAKKLGIKVLWTDHADFRNWVLWNVDKRFKNLIGKKLLRTSKLADKVILISDFEKNWLENLFGKVPENFSVIKNGALDKKKDYESLKPEKGSFVFLGRIVEEKGIPELLSVFEKVSEKFPDSKLRLVGSGPDLERFKSETKEKKNVFFLGETSEPLKALVENEVFILPSRREGLSLSLLDAAMMEKTIIATDIGATSEVIKNRENGLLVHSEDSESLKKAMLEVLENKVLAEKLAKNARKTFEKNFDFSKIFEEKMLPLYNIDKN